jgi:peptidyl-prolyl cis-trans isomerase SurA
VTTPAIAFSAITVVALSLLGPAEARGEGPVRLDGIAAVVNDEIILLSELDDALAIDPRLQEAVQALGPNPTPAKVALVTAEIRQKVLDDYIDRKLVLMEGVRLGISPGQREVDAYLDRVAKGNEMGDIAGLRKAVEESGEYGTWEEYVNKLREDIIWYQTTQVLVNWSVSDAQVREQYRKLARGEDEKVEAFAFDFRPARDDAPSRDRARALAESIVRRLQSGDDVAAIATELTQDDEPVRIARGELPPTLEDALFAAKDGSIVGPLPSGQGFRVYKLIKHLASDVVPFEQAKDAIRAQLEFEAEERARADFSRTLRAKAHIEPRI